MIYLVVVFVVYVREGAELNFLFAPFEEVPARSIPHKQLTHLAGCPICQGLGWLAGSLVREV